MTPSPMPFPTGAAAFARSRLANAQANGILPQNFQMANTGQNILGQFHQLAGAIGMAKTQSTASRAHQLINSAISGLNNGHNVANNPGMTGPSYGAFNARHPMAAPGGQGLLAPPMFPAAPGGAGGGHVADATSMPVGGQTLPGQLDIASLLQLLGGQGGGIPQPQSTMDERLGQSRINPSQISANLLPFLYRQMQVS